MAKRNRNKKTTSDGHDLTRIAPLLNQSCDYLDYGTGFGNYIKALANNDLESVDSNGSYIAESAFSSISTIGKLMVYGDIKEVSKDQIGWLLVMLSEIGANAGHHASEAAFLKKEL